MLYEGDLIMSQALINTRYTMQTYQIQGTNSNTQHLENIEIRFIQRETMFNDQE